MNRSLALNCLFLLLTAVTAIDFCHDCAVEGTSPFCAGKCSDCPKTSSCYHVSCGAGCWTGHKVACCPNEMMTAHDVIDYAKSSDKVPLTAGFNPTDFAKCLASKLGLSFTSVFTCAAKCTTSVSCYPGCLGLSFTKVFPVLLECGLSGTHLGVAASAEYQNPIKPLRFHPDVYSVFLGDDTNYTTASISNGYGQATTLGISATIGVTATLTVNISISAVSNVSFTDWKSKVRNDFSDEDWHTLEENYGAAGFAGGFFCGGFGLLFGGGDYNHYKNQHDKTVTANTTKQQGFLHTTSSVVNSDVHITGTVNFTGVSYIPSEFNVYLEVTTINFSNGKSLKVINTGNPLVANKQGQQGTVTGANLNESL